MREYLMQEEKETQMKRKEMIKNDEVENHCGDEQAMSTNFYSMEL